MLMRALTSCLLALALVAPMAAEEADEYRLSAKGVMALGNGWTLLRFGTVTLEAGDVDTFTLSLDKCPGGVESSPDLYVAATTPGEAWVEKGWFHPTAYNNYSPDVRVTIANQSEGLMTFAIKATLRCTGAPR